MSNAWGDEAWSGTPAVPHDWRFRPQLEVDGPDRQRRLSVAFRLLLLLPHVFVLLVLTIAGFVVVVIGWFAALVLGRLPGWVAAFLTGFVALSTRVFAYAMLLVDRYPGFDLNPRAGAVRIELRPGRLNRWAVLFRIVLIIPANIVGGVLMFGWYLAALPIWLVVLALGRTPVPIFDAGAAVLRFQMRYTAYAVMLTDAYPLVGTMGDRRTEPPVEGADPCRTRPLVLSGGGYALVIALIVVGAVGQVGLNVTNAVVTYNAERSAVAARQRLEAANLAAAKTANAYQRYVVSLKHAARRIPRCESRACLKKQYAAVADGAGRLLGEIDHIAFPARVTADFRALRRDILAVARAGDRMAHLAVDSDNLAADFRSVPLEEKLNAGDRSVMRLLASLGQRKAGRPTRVPATPARARAQA